MELVIVGASGYIGNEVYKEAKKRNISVLGTKNSACSEELIKFDITSDNIEKTVEGFKSTEKYALVCSAVAVIDKCFLEYEQAYNINVTSTKKVLDSLRKLGFKIVYISTDNVYNGVDGYYTEQDKTNAINAYGKMKAEVENYILEEIPNACIMRISKIIGTEAHDKNFLTELHKLIKDEKPIKCIEGSILSPTDINDIVKSFFIILERELKGLYNVCNPEHFERSEIAYQFCRRLGADVDIEKVDVAEFNFNDKRPVKTYLCSDKFIKETNYRFNSISSIINSYISKNI